MPVVITFDIQGAGTLERNRIQSFFQRLGWETLGGSSYRYPKLGTNDQPVEDWFNHIVPALMLFRCFVVTSGRNLTRFTIDVQSSAGYSQATDFGTPPLPADEVTLYASNTAAFGQARLRNWLTDTAFPY
ncbi:MAG: hypothetical protein KF810_14040 [Rhizobiaceae bacterium]|nr:hypothetical protein [Rhizobiaceae bacterium]